MSVAIFRKRGVSSKAPVLTKKDEAFKLFDLDFTPDDPEVVALGLKPESAKKYFRLWKQQQ